MRAGGKVTGKWQEKQVRKTSEASPEQCSVACEAVQLESSMTGSACPAVCDKPIPLAVVLR